MGLDFFSDRKASLIQQQLQKLQRAIKPYEDYSKYLRKSQRDIFPRNTDIIKKSLKQLTIRRLLPKSSRRKRHYNLCSKGILALERFLLDYLSAYADHCAKNIYRDFFSKHELDPNIGVLSSNLDTPLFKGKFPRRPLLLAPQTRERATRVWDIQNCMKRRGVQSSGSLLHIKVSNFRFVHF